MPTVSIQVFGKVQGVYYRASTREKAQELGLSGWVCNLPDGSVLVQASGPQTLLQQLEAWCRSGPQGASVSHIVVNELPETTFSGFRVIR